MNVSTVARHGGAPRRATRGRYRQNHDIGQSGVTSRGGRHRHTDTGAGGRAGSPSAQARIGCVLAVALPAPGRPCPRAGRGLRRAGRAERYGRLSPGWFGRFGDQGGGDVAEFAVGVLRHFGEDGERFLRGAAAIAHDDALGLLDHGPVLHRLLQVSGQGGLGLVQVGVGQADGGEPGERLGEGDRVVVEGVRLGGVDVERAGDLLMHRQAD